MNEGCYDANEMQKVKILFIFSGTKSRAVRATAPENIFDGLELSLG